MVQQELPFEAPIQPGWVGKRYLLCSDSQWHLVLQIAEDGRADTQCCEDVYAVLPVPNGTGEPTCEVCTGLHFSPKK